jgi:hypothetical protein
MTLSARYSSAVSPRYSPPWRIMVLMLSRIPSMGRTAMRAASQRIQGSMALKGPPSSRAALRFIPLTPTSGWRSAGVSAIW